MESSLRKRAVYILFNEMNSQYRFRATRFVMDQGHIPLYPTMVGDFFNLDRPLHSVSGMSDRVRPPDRDRMLRQADEVWVFGDPSTSMQTQITLARRLGKPVKQFQVHLGGFLEKE